MCTYKLPLCVGGDNLPGVEIVKMKKLIQVLSFRFLERQNGKTVHGSERMSNLRAHNIGSVMLKSGPLEILWFEPKPRLSHFCGSSEP